jgi:hypothetical protein
MFRSCEYPPMLSRNKKLLFPRLSIKSCNSYLVKMSVNLKLTLHRFSGREQLVTGWRLGGSKCQLFG